MEKYPNYLYSCQLLACSSEPWNRKICMHFVDNEGVQRSFFLEDHDPCIILRFSNSDFDDVTNVEDYLQHIFQQHNIDLYRMVSHITCENRTPVVGFSNERSDNLFTVHLNDIFHRGKFTKTIDAHNELSTCADDIICILHRRVNDIMSLLHTTGWRLHSWFALNDNLRTTSSGRIGRIYKHDIRVYPSYNKQVHLPILFLRISSHSSTATRSNIFSPDHAISDDYIEVIHATIRYMDKATHHVQHTFSKQSFDNNINNTSVFEEERDLLISFNEWVHMYRPCIIVHMSDPYDHLAYLHFRMKRSGINHTLSMFKRCVCSENKHMHSGGFRDLTCPGRETVDILHVLQKFMISPSLDGYTIEDAIAHPSLLRRNTESKDTYTINMISTLASYQNIDTIFQTLTIKVQQTMDECHILMQLEFDNSFVVNNIALSRSCDLSLTHIISRGQQTRVFSCFMREYCKQGLYLNHDILEKNYITVKRKRCDSSFPDKPWLENPSIDKLTRGGHDYNSQKEKIIIPESISNQQPKKKNVFDLLMEKKKTKVVKKKKKRYGGGFVIQPVPGFYHEARHSVITLDFASLYPSIMCGYRICYMRVCYDRKWLDDPLAKKEYIPLDDDTCCVLITHYDGKPVRSITDTLVWDVMKNRKQIRTQMKTVTDEFIRKSLDAQQLCCKVLQNAFYGACGSDTFAIPCTAIAASVCVIGQWMNKTVRYTAVKRGCICVYGDTDSVMVQFPTDKSLKTDDEILSSIYKQAISLEHETTACFPKPNAVEFETMKRPFLMTDRKKTYAAYEYPPISEGWKKQPCILIKGFAIKKRDRCTFVQYIGLELVRRLLSFDHSEDELLVWFLDTVSTQFVSKPSSEQTLQPFLISCRLNDVYKQENVIGPWMATQYEEESGTRPLPGKRLKYVIATFKDGRKHYQSAVTPTRFLRDNMSLDASYYLNKQLMLAIKQVLNRHVTLFHKIQLRINQTIQQEKNNQQGIKSVLSFLKPSKKRKLHTS